ncbi:hypothetical protein BgiMline_008558, partial [Biomphalaria glabrata]
MLYILVPLVFSEPVMSWFDFLSSWKPVATKNDFPQWSGLDQRLCSHGPVLSAVRMVITPYYFM